MASIFWSAIILCVVVAQAQAQSNRQSVQSSVAQAQPKRSSVQSVLLQKHFKVKDKSNKAQALFKFQEANNLFSKSSTIVGPNEKRKKTNDGEYTTETLTIKSYIEGTSGMKSWTIAITEKHVVTYADRGFTQETKPYKPVGATGNYGNPKTVIGPYAKVQKDFDEETITTTTTKKYSLKGGNDVTNWGSSYTVKLAITAPLISFPTPSGPDVTQPGFRNGVSTTEAPPVQPENPEPVMILFPWMNYPLNLNVQGTISYNGLG